MTFYSKDITTPAGTTAAAPKVTRIKIIKGIIHRFQIYFPPGNQGLHKIRIFHGGSQVIPINEDEHLTMEGSVGPFPEHIELMGASRVLRVLSWNEDTVNDHTVHVMFGILPKELVSPKEAQAELVTSLKLLLRRLGILRT